MEAHPTSTKLYQVSGWPEHFEGAKSKTYKNKSSCQMPTKHGLGYKRIIRRKNGPALFGAWCSMVQVLSRHPAPRHGYCTDTGRIDGSPYTPEELELLTDIDQKLFVELLEVASSQDVGWLRIPDGYHTDTVGVKQYPLDSDSDSDLNSDLNSDTDSRDKRGCSGARSTDVQRSLTCFESFWKSWPSHPRKVDKAKCAKHWKAHKLDSKADEIMAGLEAWKHSDAWTKDGGQFIPLPATWLNNERWNDMEAARAKEPESKGIGFMRADTGYVPPKEYAT